MLSGASIPATGTSLRWGQIDFENEVLTVGRAKTSSGTGRQIPLNSELVEVLTRYRDWYRDRFDGARREWYVFPFGKPTPQDPTRPITTIKTAWNTLRPAASVECRLHDLRHTTLTTMAEQGASEHSMLAIAGHMSRAMLERYSHIRMAAKREAMKSLKTIKTIADSDGDGHKNGHNSASGQNSALQIAF
jgi:integrase